MAVEGIALNIDAADVQVTYYALQKVLNTAWAINQLIAILLPLLLFFSGWGARAYRLLLRHLRIWWIAMRSDAAANPMLFRYTSVTRYFRATHPEIRARIEYAESYRPWADDEPLVYAEHFGE